MLKVCEPSFNDFSIKRRKIVWRSTCYKLLLTDKYLFIMEVCTCIF